MLVFACRVSRSERNSLLAPPVLVFAPISGIIFGESGFFPSASLRVHRVRSSKSYKHLIARSRQALRLSVPGIIIDAAALPNILTYSTYVVLSCLSYPRRLGRNTHMHHAHALRAPKAASGMPAASRQTSPRTLLLCSSHRCMKYEGSARCELLRLAHLRQRPAIMLPPLPSRAELARP